MVIDDTPSTKHHAVIIIKSEANDLHMLVDNIGAFDISKKLRSIKTHKAYGCSSSLYPAPDQQESDQNKLSTNNGATGRFSTKRVGRILFQNAMRNIGFDA